MSKSKIILITGASHVVTIRIDSAPCKAYGVNYVKIDGAYEIDVENL